jgi:catechol 2,3-dioxygenase-like lactoylglutathione lyase family enzyme
MRITNANASLAVSNLETATRWYAELFGRAPDARPQGSRGSCAEWQFARDCWLRVEQRPARAGRGSVTLAVADIGEPAARLDALGIRNRGCTASPSVRTLMIADPDGNHIAFAQATEAAQARLLAAIIASGKKTAQ